ncbi:MAG: hypothetical protein LBR49_04665 [Tannerella sp.]|nr:hypothetical protein [Tannerella sp.]
MTIRSVVPNTANITTNYGLESSYTYYAQVTNSFSNTEGIDEYEWNTVYSGWTIEEHPVGGGYHPMDRIRVTGTASSPTTALRVRAHNACGWSNWIQVGTLTPSAYYSAVYPNPSTGLININIEVNRENFAAKTDATRATLSKTPTFDLRIYNTFSK